MVLLEAEKLYANRGLETAASFGEFLEAQDEMKGAFAAAGVAGSEVFGYYYGTVVPSTPENASMVARMVEEEKEAAKEDGNNTDDEPAAKRSRSFFYDDDDDEEEKPAAKRSSRVGDDSD